MDADRAAQLARFWARVQQGDGCWEWTGFRDPKGYGRFQFEGRPMGVHRLSWLLHHGPIPAGLHVLHRCDNPPCVNPDHLWLGTNDDNIADRHAKGRDAHNAGEAGARAKLTERQVLDIRAAAAGGAGLGDLARLYRVSHATIWCLVKRRSWTCVPEMGATT